jgi:hypothetical protein
VIYESLVQGTLARAARRVKVHNLGLEPWEGLEMGLQVETFERRKQQTPVAKYVKERLYYGYTDENGEHQTTMRTGRNGSRRTASNSTR